jgi:hypothetical protein
MTNGTRGCNFTSLVAECALPDYVFEKWRRLRLSPTGGLTPSPVEERPQWVGPLLPAYARPTTRAMTGIKATIKRRPTTSKTAPERTILVIGIIPEP